MEITSGGVGLSLDAHIAAALDIMRYSARRRRPHREEQSMAERILGSGASREAIYQYRHRLLNMLGQLDMLELPPELDLPELRPDWCRSLHVRVGSVVWTSPPLEPVRLWTPLPQLDQTEKFLAHYQTVANLGEPVEVHRSRIILGQGTERVDTDMADAVHVSSDGMRVLQDPELPVMVTRIPPRFPTVQQMLQFKRPKGR